MMDLVAACFCFGTTPIKPAAAGSRCGHLGGYAPCAAAPSACLSRTLGPSGRAGPQAAVPGFLSTWLPLPSPWAL